MCHAFGETLLGYLGWKHEVLRSDELLDDKSVIRRHLERRCSGKIGNAVHRSPEHFQGLEFVQMSCCWGTPGNKSVIVSIDSKSSLEVQGLLCSGKLLEGSRAVRCR